MTTFQISYTSGQYWYHLRADNGEIVQSGEGYTTKASCQNGIRSVQANCQPQRFESFFNAGQYGFNHVAANGEIIGRSEKYTTAQSRDHGIQVVLREAPTARVEDLS
ncbi:YegP family protein [Hymenobacter sp. DH14]|uniref:YegP family protein n=1 Tax=Hymenobacter cyanobacteriorum TaxID=2926463 RepID=A0A9X1VKJ3_9BACT|nr:YegP family protein [Hymenobacter cyanobacteriorum]MCI1188720.1 YegP family protein [Hymenobacter cyanobacteriorum]